MFNPRQNQSDSNTCSSCGKSNSARASVCGYCGAILMNQRPARSTHTDERPKQPLLNNTCPHCHEPNRPGALICETCSASLVEYHSDTITTSSIEKINRGSGHLVHNPSALETLDVTPFLESAPNVERRRGSEIFDANMYLSIEINGYRDPLELHIQDTEIVLGRRDATSNPVDLDLSPYSAHQKGVSRHHAVIMRQGQRLILWDLGSANGTFLNGKRLNPHQHHRLQDGDELSLGHMSMRVLFHRSRLH